MNTQIEFYQDMSTGRWSWVLRVSNGQEAARSAKTYATASAVRKAWGSTVDTISEGNIPRRTFPVSVRP